MGNFHAKEGLVSPDTNKVGDIGSSLFSDLFCGLQLVIYITMTAFSIFSGVTGSLLCLLPADLLAIMVFIIIIICYLSIYNNNNSRNSVNILRGSNCTNHWLSIVMSCKRLMLINW